MLLDDWPSDDDSKIDAGGAPVTYDTIRGGPARWLTPAEALLLFPPVTTRAEYLDWVAGRRTGIGGSDAPGIYGAPSAWSSPYRVWLDKTGRLPELADNRLLERGRRVEPVCAQWFADDTGLHLQRTGTWARADYPWMRASPDRFTSDGGLLECKCVGEDWGRLWRDGPALHALLQMLWYFAVFPEVTHGYIAAVMDRAPWFRWWRIDRDDYEECIADLVWVVSRFWYERVLLDEPPPVDGSEATADAIREAYPAPRAPADWPALAPGVEAAWRRLQEIKAQQKGLDEERRLLESQLAATAGAAEVVEDVDTGARVGWVHRTRRESARPARVIEFRQFKEMRDRDDDPRPARRPRARRGA